MNAWLCGRESGPYPFRDFDTRAGDLRILPQEVCRQRDAELLDLIDADPRGQRVHRVLHGVGRQHFPVVAGDVRLLEVSFESNRDGQVLHVVPIAVTHDLDEPDSRLAVTVRA